jgi:hypothetical protein
MKFRTPLMIACVVLVGLAGMTIADIAQKKQTASRALLIAVSDADIENLLYMRQEEKLARDVYLTLYEQWGAEIFANISESEQQHMDAIKRLIDIYGLEDPIIDNTAGQFPDQDFIDLYEQFVALGSASLLDALNVGVSIEQQDTADLEEALEETTARNVKRVFENLLTGSENHLAAFQECIETCDLECPQAGTGDNTCLQIRDRDLSCQDM